MPGEPARLASDPTAGGAATARTAGRWLRGILVAAAALLTAAQGVRTVRLADQLPSFVDEMVNTQAAVSFFRSGNYTSTTIPGVFPPAISSGVLATWPSALPFLLGTGTLFEARLCLGAWWWLTGTVLVFAFLRRRGVAPSLAAALAGLVWAALFLVPYTAGHLHNLGELGGAIFLGWGAFLLPGRPFLGGLLLGASVWGCKLIYLPAALALAVGVVLPAANEASALPRRERCLRLAAGLAVPLVALLAWITVGFSVQHTLAWCSQWLAFVLHGGSGVADRPAGSLVERLLTLEWPTYSTTLRVRLLALTFGPAAGVALVLAGTRLRPAPPLRPALVALAATLCLHGAWYFLYSPFMYLHHMQPAMLVGFGLWGCLGAQVVVPLLRRRGALRALSAGLLLIALGHAAATVLAGPILSAAPSYARLSREPRV